MKSKLHRAVLPVKAKPLTRQMMLENIVSYYLIDGNPPAIDERGVCRYYVDGQKCGIGCQFTDEQAKEIERVFHGNSVNAVLRDYSHISNVTAEVLQLAHNTIEPEELDFALRLQQAHDGAALKNKNTNKGGPAFRHQLWKNLAQIAGDLGLKLQPVDEVVASINE